MKRIVLGTIQERFLQAAPASVALGLVMLIGMTCHAAISPFLSATFSPDPASNPTPDVYSNTTVITSFTTSSGPVSDLSHAIFGNGNFDVSGGSVFNLWGSDGVEIDGPLAVLNLDVATGVINGGDTDDTSTVDVGTTGGTSMNFFYSQDINSGVAGTANDFFLLETRGNDTIDIVPIDAAGNPIGDFTMTILDTDWGLITPQISRVADNTGVAIVPVGGVAFDFEDFAGTGTLTGMRGIAISGADGLDALVIGVNEALAPAPEPTLTVNRNTGAITLDNPGAAPLNFLGYSITSESESFNPVNWKSIAANYDSNNDQTVDANDEWTELTGSDTHTDLSEFGFGGDGGTIAGGSSVVLSEGGAAWIGTPTEDLLGRVVLTDGTYLPVTVVFEGNGGVPLLRSDLNQDGAIDENDWVILRNNTLEDLSLLSPAEQYVLGDVTGDGSNDISDFILFVSDFEDFNGGGSFAAMLQSVPEPSSLLLLGLGFLGLVSLRSRKGARVACLLILSITLGSWNREANAVVIASENFESYPAVVGDPNPHFGGSDENGGVGWTSPWAIGTTPVNEMHIRSDLLTDYGKGLEITNLGNPSDTNVITRQFTTQDDDFYVGFTMRTSIDSAGIDDHLLFYLSDDVTSDHNIGYGGGTLRGADVAGNFFTRQGNNTTHVNSGITQVYGDTYNVVMKFKKTGVATDPFSGIDMWIDQETEGAPDVISTTGTASLAELSTFHIWFDPRDSNSANRAHLALDNLVVATTYEDALSLVNAPPILPFQALVHPITGEVAMLNSTANPVEFNAYQVVSVGADTLNPAGWNSLSDQNLDPVDDGLDLGETWDEAGTPSAASLAEQFLLGSTTLAPGDSVSLGTIYDVSEGGDFELKFHDIGFLAETTAEVVFALLGDMDGSGVVDSADVNPFVQALTDRAAFDLTQPNVVADLVGDFNGNGRLDLGDVSGFKSAVAGSGTGSAASNAVPEPSSALLLLVSLLGLTARSQRLRRKGCDN